MPNPDEHRCLVCQHPHHAALCATDQGVTHDAPIELIASDTPGLLTLRPPTPPR